jgi:Holliday junction resolvasome RuvABC ATP-dependent DNA helicase subunit
VTCGIDTLVGDAVQDQFLRFGEIEGVRLQDHFPRIAHAERGLDSELRDCLIRVHCRAVDRLRGDGEGARLKQTLPATGSAPRDAIEEIIEPFLIQQGLVQRTPRGRLLAGHAFRHLGLAEPARDPGQFQLLAGDDDSGLG